VNGSTKVAAIAQREIAEQKVVRSWPSAFTTEESPSDPVAREPIDRVDRDA
jgi:hypothetical protein